MEKDTKKNITPDINEELMMNLMVDGAKKEGLEIPRIDRTEIENSDMERIKSVSTITPSTTKKISKPRNIKSYGEHFLIAHSMTKRGDKSIYIRKEYHERLSRIIQVIGKDEIPLYAYLDNILEHHFELFEEAITSDFNEHFKPLF
ncbi:hypothetical protein AB670_01814 [Chryseobacterium sp. MOF25P]|uniref:DUF3408 domain-containing protein n=1 Tax=unclassified Chryseobacterium TaxID=2593645 RepID=UPI000804FD25|nr:MULTISPECIES: DUF3408 domain-containing protein [unclassified Chryseobacterium]OBW41821.1 hypothetical protein AB670_01814 [Chryseobacterium sp. MOF25P]OBW44639.1 hypothetical protein AB671_03260 [Chryseobacterium sp. BGARF1]